MKKTKKVGFIHYSFPFGGGERVTIDIANYVKSRGYEVVVFAVNFTVPHDLLTDFTLVKLPEANISKSRAVRAVILRSVEEMSIDIVVSVGCWMLGFSDELHQLGCKSVFSLHSIPFWEIHYHRLTASRRAKKNIFKALKWYLFTNPKHLLIQNDVKKTHSLYRHAIGEYDAFTVLCEDYLKSIESTLSLSQCDKIKVIHNSENPVSDVNFDKKKQFMYVGRLDVINKRVDRLIEAWGMISRQLPAWELLIVGDGPDREHLEHYVEKKSVERVSFEGYHADVSGYYTNATAVCLVSDFEGWPLCLTEAQAAGVIPIAFNCSAGVEAILSPSGKNGFLVSPEDVKGLSEQMLQVARLDKKELRQMQENVLKKSVDYSPEIVGKKWLELFDSLCES